MPPVNKSEGLQFEPGQEEAVLRMSFTLYVKIIFFVKKIEKGQGPVKNSYSF